MPISEPSGSPEPELALPPDDAPPPLALETFLGDAPPAKYVKKRNIGSGEYGEAWICSRAVDGQLFVAKVMNMLGTPARRRRYVLGEIRCLKSCEHPNIIRYVEDSGTTGDQVVIIMELADASDLGSQLANPTVNFTEREAGILFVQLILALHHAHKRRVIHRDVKASNVFLTTSGLVKLGDFGFSQQYDQTVSGSVAATFLGTPYYLAPEMWLSRRYGKKTDVWAAGIVLFETLTKKRPFLGQSLEELKSSVLGGRLDKIPGISGDMMELIVCTLHPEPAKRPTTAELLGMPLVQHYLTMYLTIVNKDTQLDPKVKSEILQTVADAQADAANAKLVPTLDDDDPRHESMVLKETDGKWKERLLLLNPPQLIMTLAPGKEAAPGTDRSKRINIANIASAVKLDDEVASNGSKRYLFALQLNNASNIIFGVTDEQARDVWLAKLHTALGVA